MRHAMGKSTRSGAGFRAKKWKKMSAEAVRDCEHMKISILANHIIRGTTAVLAGSVRQLL